MYNKAFTISKKAFQLFSKRTMNKSFFCDINKKTSNKSFDSSTENITRKLNNLYRFHEEIKGSTTENIEDNEQNTDDKQQEQKSNIESQPSVITKAFQGLKNLWQKTFPPEKDYEKINILNMELAKNLKSKIKWPKEEEIEKILKIVPEWKQTAVVLVEETIFAEKESKLDHYFKVLSEKIKHSESYSKLKESNTYKEYQQFKEDLDVIQGNIKDTIAMSYNPATILLKDLVDKVTVKATSAEAIIIMRKYDPDFDFYELEQKVPSMLKSILKAEFTGDIEFIEAICKETALAIESTKIKFRKEKGLECKIKEPVYIDVAHYHNSVIIDSDNVRFQFIINVQENNCLINQEGEVVEGKPSLVENCHYVVELYYDPDAEVDITGHNWVFSKIERTGVVEQLI